MREEVGSRGGFWLGLLGGWRQSLGLWGQLTRRPQNSFGCIHGTSETPGHWSAVSCCSQHSHSSGCWTEYSLGRTLLTAFIHGFLSSTYSQTFLGNTLGWYRPSAWPFATAHSRVSIWARGHGSWYYYAQRLTEWSPWCLALVQRALGPTFLEDMCWRCVWDYFLGKLGVLTR